MPALEQDESESEQREVACATTEAQHVVDDVVGDCDDGDEDREDDQRCDPPEREVTGGGEAGQAQVGAGERERLLAPARVEQVAAEVREAGRVGVRARCDHAASIASTVGAPTRPRARARLGRLMTPSATMRLPMTQATVPRPGQVVSPASQNPGGPRSWGTACWLVLA